MTDILNTHTRAIGRYTILRELRRERHSVSYAAVDPVMNRQLVVKAVELLPAGPRLSSEERKRVEEAFVRQAQAAGRLQHPHIVTVFDAGLSHAFGFLVIERVNGRPLNELLAAGLRPAFVQCASIAARIADAIECAHRNGVAHGHLGPQHVFLLADGAPKVSGFGGWIDDGASGDEALAGTARLLPYFQNEITEETRLRDVRAVGELLFMMLAGRAPASAANAEVGSSPTLGARPDVPATLARIVDQALASGNPSGLKTAGAIRDALTSFIWNERTDNVAPNTLGIPLAAPPPRPAVNVATLTPADDIAALGARLQTPSPGAATPSVAPTAPRLPVLADGLENPATPGMLEVFKTLGIDVPALTERVRPWATRNRLPLFSAGALLSAGIFLGVVLGNLRHPEAAAAGSEAAAATRGQLAAPPAPGPAALVGGPVTFAIRPWGEVFIDGKPTGVAPPLTQVQLAAGHHRIEVFHADAPPWQTEIEIAGPGGITIDHAFP